MIPRFLVAAGVLSALVLTLAFHFGTESMWWVEIARYVPFPGYLVPALGCVLLSWRLNRIWQAAALTGLGLVLTLVMGMALGHADAGSDRVRLMTYNIKAYLAVTRPDGFSRLDWEIAMHDPDIIVMQDAQVMPSHPPVAESLKGALGDRQIYQHEQYLIASRFPLHDCAPGDMSYEKEPSEYVRCTVSAHGREIDLFAVHFVSPRQGLNAARGEQGGGLGEWERNFSNRLVQAEHLSRALSNANHPVIVAGDMNAQEDSPVVRRVLATGLRDAFSSAGLGYGFTYGHDLRPGFSFLRIDHILLSSAIGVHDCFVGGREASQHRPVIADLLLHRH